MKGLLKSIRVIFFLSCFFLVFTQAQAQEDCEGAQELIDLANEQEFDPQNDARFLESSNVCFFNGSNVQVSFQSRLTPDTDLSFDRSCQNVVIPQLITPSNSFFFSLNIFGDVRISNLIGAVPEEGSSAGINVTGEFSNLTVEQLDYENEEESPFSSLTVNDKAKFNLLAGDLVVKASMDGGVSIVSSEVSMGNSLITSASIFNTSGYAIQIIGSDLTIGEDFELGGGEDPQGFGGAFFDINKSTVTIGNDFRHKSLSTINFGSETLFDVAGTYEILFNNSEMFLPELLSYVDSESCAVVRASNVEGYEQLSPDFPLSFSPNMKVCNWPQAILDAIASNDAFGEAIESCETCVTPALEVGQVFSNVKVGDVITILGDNLDVSTELELASTIGSDGGTFFVQIFDVQPDGKSASFVVPNSSKSDRLILNGTSIDLFQENIVIDRLEPSAFNTGDEVWVYGNNLQKVSEVIYQSSQGNEQFVPIDAFDAQSQDSMRFIAVAPSSCNGAFRVARFTLDDGVMESEPSVGLMTSPSVVTNPNATGEGSFQDILQNSCDSAIITFSPLIDTFYYDFIELDVNNISLPAAKNVTIRGNGKGNTILVDENQIDGGFIISGLTYTFEDMSFQNTVSSGTLPTGVFNIRGSDPLAGPFFRSDVTFRNVEFKDNVSTSFSGVAYVGFSNASFTDCDFISNSGNEGGALSASQGGIINVGNCNFDSNTATTRGGAIAALTLGTVTITDCDFTKNNSFRDGGALSVTSSSFSAVTSFKITGSNFIENNSVFNGGAVYARGGGMSLDSCAFVRNVAGNAGLGDGGAVYRISDFSDLNIEISITKSLFDGNKAIGDTEDGGAGGAFYDDSQGFATIVDQCTFINNTAIDGAGIFSSDFNVQSSTFYNNEATGGGGAMFSNGDVFNLLNSTVYKNKSGLGGAIYAIPEVSASLSGVMVSNAIGENTSTTLNTNADVILMEAFEYEFAHNYFTDSSGIGTILSNAPDGFESHTNLVFPEGLYFNPLPQNTGLQTYFLPYSFSPLVDNGAVFDNTNLPAPLPRGVLNVNGVLDQLGELFSDNTDIGGVELRNATDPMHITLLSDELTEGSIRGAELFYNTHYPADTMTFDPSIAGGRIELDSPLYFELSLDPAGQTERKFLRIDGDTSVTITFTNESVLNSGDAILTADTEVNIDRLKIDGKSENGTFFNSACIRIVDGDYNHTLDSSIIRNCDVGLHTNSTQIAVQNSFFYGSTIDVTLSNDDFFLTPVISFTNNVVGLNENFEIVAKDFDGDTTAGIFVQGNNFVIGGPLEGQGNVIAGSDAGIVVFGSGNRIEGNYVGILKDSTTILGNEIWGITFFADGSSDFVTDNVVSSNLIAGSNEGIEIPPFGIPTGDFNRNVFSQNLFIANETAILLYDTISVNSKIKPPLDLKVSGTILSGIAEDGAQVQIYLDSADNASFYVAEVPVPVGAGGVFSFDLATVPNLPSNLGNITTLQTNTSKGSSALSRPVARDCSVYDDSLKFGEISGVCIDPLVPEIVITTQFARENASYEWFIEGSTSGFEPYTVSGVGDTAIFNEVGDFRFFVTMRLEEGCFLNSDTVTQKVGNPVLDFTGFEIRVDSIEVVSVDQSELLISITDSPVDSIVWSSDVFSIANDTADRPVLTSFGTGFVAVELVSEAGCALQDSLYVTYLGEPVAMDDSYQILVGSFEIFDVLINDINTNDTSLTIISAVTSNPNSFASIFENEIEYAPSSTSLDPDVITYVIQDGYGKLDTGLVFVEIVTQLDPGIVISYGNDRPDICSNDTLEILIDARNFTNQNDVLIEVTSEGGSTENILDDLGQIIGVMFIPDNQNDAQLLITANDGVDEVIETVEITIFDEAVLSDFTLTFDGKITDGEIVAYETDGQLVLGCGLIESTISNTSNVFNGLPAAITQEGIVEFIVTDSLGVCSVTRTFEAVFNEKSDTTISLKAETGDEVITDYEIDVPGFFGELELTILQNDLNFGTVSLSNNELEYISQTEQVGVIDTVRIFVRDNCGTEDTIAYIIDLKNTLPEVDPNVVISQVTQTVGEEILILKDTLSSDINNNHDEIIITNPTEFSEFLILSVVEENGIATGILARVVNEIPDDLKEVSIDYEVCDIEGCESGELILRFVEDEVVEIEDGVILSELSNSDSRELLEVILINSAVTNNVPLAFEFTWDDEKIDAEKLSYDLVIMSRWGDVVYQEQVSGEKIKWNGEYQTAGSSQKVPEGNYSWVLRAYFVNSNGNEKAKTQTGILYYVNTESVNVPD